MQRRFTKRIAAISQLSYKDRLAYLGLDTLGYRRLKFDLIMFNKIVHNLVDVDRDSLITFRPAATSTRNSYLKIFKPTCMSSVRTNFLSFRCINVWNHLSESARSASSILGFKNAVSSYDLSSFLRVFKF